MIPSPAPFPSPGADQLYRSAVALGRASVAELAARAGLDPQSASAEVQTLAEIGLLEVRHGLVRPLAPRLPLEHLAAEHTKAADLTRQTASTLAEVWAAATSQRAFLEVISDEDEARAVERSLIDNADVAVDALCIGPVSPRRLPPGMEIPPPRIANGFFEATARGVRFRCLYGVTVLEDASGLASVQECIAAGEQARVFARVPLNLLVFDGKRALCGIPGMGGARRQLVVVHESGLLDSLIGVFDVFWQMGVPLGADAQIRDTVEGPTSEERQLLSYLSAGMTDEAIARDLAVSPRTVGRRIARLEEVLGAHSRFQLAVQASRRGWM